MNDSAAQGTLLVPIDVQGVSPAALETLVTIARLLDRKLLGLVTEDARLRSAAALPFATEIALSDARERSLLDARVLERHHRMSAETRRLLNELARRERIALQFEDMIGPRWACAIARDGHLDIFVPARQRRHAPPLQTAFIPRAQPCAIQRLGVLLPASDGAAQMLSIASALINAGLVGSTDVLATRSVSAAALSALRIPGHPLRVHSPVSTDENALLQLIRQCPYTLLLVHADSLRPIAPEILELALEHSAAQVMVIHQPAS